MRQYKGSRLLLQDGFCLCLLPHRDQLLQQPPTDRSTATQPLAQTPPAPPSNMHFSSSILVALAATVSAIDIRAYGADNCNGGYRQCANINPDVCCVFSDSDRSGLTSISAAAIPTNWRIHVSGATGGGCKFFGGDADSNGADFVCLPYHSRGDRTGGKYWFVNRKRALDHACPAEQPDAKKCTSTVKYNSVGLADGAEYDITGLSEDKVKELEKVAFSGASADAVPAEFHARRR
ncbi:hypothetical protein MAPG_03465 [Magnaporthiopsis poae ATCC 64411]|uniref:Uncharacterized protein n=1 Tax=Magnaporthiopsis poae (strain ATCC 64411 / 73-15) TaxID=644358 RepID=A0A0C4DU31_MAGP6|nr:hypothetical protein MAPG_03465 [Magnaporthiopsis poae ATCC 64411]